MSTVWWWCHFSVVFSRPLSFRIASHSCTHPTGLVRSDSSTKTLFLHLLHSTTELTDRPVVGVSDLVEDHPSTQTHGPRLHPSVDSGEPNGLRGTLRGERETHFGPQRRPKPRVDGVRSRVYTTPSETDDESLVYHPPPTLHPPSSLRSSSTQSSGDGRVSFLLLPDRSCRRHPHSVSPLKSYIKLFNQIFS